LVPFFPDFEGSSPLAQASPLFKPPHTPGYIRKGVPSPSTCSNHCYGSHRAINCAYLKIRCCESDKSCGDTSM
jgi:hypothetical protein